MYSRHLAMLIVTVKTTWLWTLMSMSRVAADVGDNERHRVSRKK